MLRILVAGVLVFAAQAFLPAQEPDLAKLVSQLDGAVFSADAAKEKQLDRMLERDIRARNHAAQQRQADAFAKLTSKADWEQFRAERMQALRKSLGPLPVVGNLEVQVGGKHRGDGYERADIAFISHGQQIITANLYKPAQPTEKMPGIIILHGFHQPKTQGELQDMGVTWARLGCVVLVPDMLCHGERKQHPFVSAQSYTGKFNLPRQDYYSRANAGLQLSLVGESLMGWMVFDAVRCVDMLTTVPGLDREKIILLGAVAAGGDVAAVAAAFDQRVKCVVPFNFGGPEPETVHPLPETNTEQAFPYGVGGHWDSTRRLRDAGRDGFLPWMIVAAAAPRRVVYAHEFAWDRERDPVWARLEKVFGWYDARGNLASVNGSGTLFGNPEGTGCANIGPVHRKELYPHLTRWFDIPTPKQEAHDRKTAAELNCLWARVRDALQPMTIQQHLVERAKTVARADDVRTARKEWLALLGSSDPGHARVSSRVTAALGKGSVERIVLEPEPGIVIPMLLLLPARQEQEAMPIVIGVAQGGKQEFLKQRADTIASLLASGIGVCLPDVRGTGETLPAGERRGPPAGSYKGVLANSPTTILANESLLLGQPLLVDRLGDLRSVIRYLQTRTEARIGVWGDSFARVNGADERVDVPWDAEQLPAQAEPLGQLLALLASLYEGRVGAVYTQGGLVSFQALLASPFCHVPPDVIVPGVLKTGDLDLLVKTVSLRPVRQDGLVDGHNRRVAPTTVEKTTAAEWLTQQLKR